MIVATLQGLELAHQLIWNSAIQVAQFEHVFTAGQI